jgi:hypothetical protein
MSGYLNFDENGNVTGKLEFSAEDVDLLLSLGRELKNSLPRPLHRVVKRRKVEDLKSRLDRWAKPADYNMNVCKIAVGQSRLRNISFDINAFYR